MSAFWGQGGGFLMIRTAVQALVALSLGMLVAVPAADAQQPAKVPRIGLIGAASPPDPLVEAFLQGLRELGYVEGRTIAIEYRRAEGNLERIPDLTAELVRLKIEVIVTPGQFAPAAKQATSTVPIVLPVSSDPVAAGLVANLARPGGNVTGLSMMSPELSEKRMELLKEALPKLSRVAVLRDPRQPPTDLPPTEAVGRALGLRLQVLEVRSLDDLEAALAAAKKGRAGALNMLPSAFFFAHRAGILEAVTKARLPAMYHQREFVDLGASCPTRQSSPTSTGAPPPTWTRS